ncbi:hypothetical protein [Desulfosporosinus sp. BG]|uniref:hypothetical protein n=1 Tax=Desulfosporosinus sp. BG TaxID=1633135 RepID=UPI00083A9B88|nr:hypothetical protein [Desulfosporosinus sp. BG]ODA42660.1 hypothetical protein DSBG_0534 [Desulfosporosinus sp. BG]
MSIFTVVIIIWAIYQLMVSVMKKSGRQQVPSKPSDPFRLPDGRFIRDVIQGTSFGNWKEQLKQALENVPYQTGSLRSTKPNDFEAPEDYYVETEGTQGIEGTQGTEGTQGIEGTSDYVGILGLEAYKSTEEIPREEVAKEPLGLRGIELSLTERELVQGVIWAEILGKPRSLRPFRGPRS